MGSILSVILRSKNTNEIELGKKINEKAGTLAFLLSDIEWDNKDRIYDIFNIPTEWGGLYMIKDKHNKLNFLYVSKKHGDLEVESSDLSGFEKKSKHHVSVTWSPNEVKLYIDGKLNNSKKRLR